MDTITQMTISGSITTTQVGAVALTLNHRYGGGSHVTASVGVTTVRAATDGARRLVTTDVFAPAALIQGF